MRCSTAATVLTYAIFTTSTAAADIRGAFGGALIGYGAAVIIDALFVARSTHAAPTRAPRWSPTLAASPGGASVGVAGVF